MESPKTPLSSYSVVKRNRSSSLNVPTNNRTSKTRPKSIQNISDINKPSHKYSRRSMPPSPFSPSSALQGLSVSDTESDNSSDEESMELPSKLHPAPITISLDFYKNKMKDLAETYKEFINQGVSKRMQTQPSPQQTESSPNSYNSTSPSKRSSRHTQEDVNNANLLLLLRMIV